MLENITGEALTHYKKNKSETERSKAMKKYAQMKRYHHDSRHKMYI